MKNNQAQKLVKFITVLITLTSLALIFYSLTNTQTLNQATSTQIETYGITALLLTSLLLDLIPQILSPAIALAAAILAGINIYYAIAITILGSTIGSIIGFMLGKKYMYKAVDIMTSKKSTQRLTSLTNKYGKIIIPLAAISPLPYLPVLFGTMNFTKRNFVIYGLIPRAIGIIIYGYIITLL